MCGCVLHSLAPSLSDLCFARVCLPSRSRPVLTLLLLPTSRRRLLASMQSWPKLNTLWMRQLAT